MARIGNPEQHKLWGWGQIFKIRWQKLTRRYFCRRKGHAGTWTILTDQRGYPRLGYCKRCHAIAEFDIYNRRIYYD